MDLKSIPTWGWVAGGGVVIGGAFLLTRKQATTDTTGQNSQLTDMFAQLMASLTALQQDIAQGKNPVAPVNPQPTPEGKPGGIWNYPNPPITGPGGSGAGGSAGGGGGGGGAGGGGAGASAPSGGGAASSSTADQSAAAAVVNTNVLPTTGTPTIQSATSAVPLTGATQVVKSPVTGLNVRVPNPADQSRAVPPPPPQYVNASPRPAPAPAPSPPSSDMAPPKPKAPAPTPTTQVVKNTQGYNVRVPTG